MNTADAAPIIQQATRNQRANRSWCLIRPQQALDLTAAVAERDVLLARLAEIDAIALEALVGTACGTCYCEVLRGIRELCQTAP